MNYDLIWTDYLPICMAICTLTSVDIFGKCVLSAQVYRAETNGNFMTHLLKRISDFGFAYTFFRNANKQVGQDSQPAGRCVDLASLLISQEIYLRTIHTNLYTINRLTYAPCAYSLHGAAKVFLITQALIANGAEDLLEKYKWVVNERNIRNCILQVKYTWIRLSQVPILYLSYLLE